MRDVASRITNRVQLTTDGHKAYLDAVEEAFHGEVDYAQLIKIYGPTAPGAARYSPPNCIGCERHDIAGTPERKHISTSIVERQNLSMRMGMRRFTRLTNAHSKKVENHAHAIALYFIAIDQDPLGRQAVRVVKSEDSEIWEKDLEGGHKAVAIFNRGETEAQITVQWSDLGVSGQQDVRDLWRQKDLGNVADRYTATVPRHGVVFLSLSNA